MSEPEGAELAVAQTQVNMAQVQMGGASFTVIITSAPLWLTPLLPPPLSRSVSLYWTLAQDSIMSF